jgi:hypothetical protein
MKTIVFSTIAVTALTVAGCTMDGMAKMDKAPAGGPNSVAFAGKLWQAMEHDRLVGGKMIRMTPYEGSEPHGFILETFDTTLKVAGREALVVVKRNYGPKGLSTDQVNADRKKHLKAVTVMFKREKGYDSDNQDWFWAKYLPDGSLDKNPKGMMLAGKVMKGAPKGCIACHKGAAPDMIFSRDR